MNTIIYARISSAKESDDESAKSIPDQIADCERFAAARGLTIIATTKDINRSGRAWASGEPLAEADTLTIEYLAKKDSKHQHRDGLAEVLRLIRSKKATTIIVRDITRLYRPVGNSIWMTWLPATLEQFGVTLLTVDGQTLKQTRDWMIPHILGMSNDEALKGQRDKAIAKKRTMRNKGIWIYSIPFGYVKTNKEFSTDKQKAATVQKIFGDFLNGKAIGAITQDLNELGVPPPAAGQAAGGRKTTPRFGELWNREAVTSIIDNLAYTGKMTNTDGREIESNLPQIITYSDYAKARSIRESNRKLVVKDSQKQTHLVSGLLVCGHCGGRMSPTKSNGYQYYHCRGRKDFGKEDRQICQANSLNYESVKEFFARFILIGVQREQTLIAEIESQRDKLDGLKQERDALIERESDLVLTADVKSDHFKRLSKTINEKIEDLDEQIQQIDALPPTQTKLSAANLETLKVFEIADEAPMQGRKFLHDAIKQATVFADRVEVEMQDGAVLNLHRPPHALPPTLLVKSSKENPVNTLTILGKADRLIYTTGKTEIHETTFGIFGDISTKRPLSPLFAQIMAIFESNKGTATTLEIQKRLEANKSTIRCYICKLHNRGVIEQIKPGTYRLKK